MTTTVVFRNGSVLRADGRTGHALAVQGGRIVAFDDDALALGGSEVDLDGGLLLPAFRDGHVHPLWGGVDLGRLPLDHCDDVDAILAAVAAYAAEHPDLPWIIGGPFRADIPPGGRGEAAWLDAVVPDRPVALSANDYHTMWVNSRALELAGIDAATPEPALGVIVRKADGTPSGTLIESGAMSLVERLLPHPSADEMQAGLARGLDHLSALGIGWVQEAAASAADGEVYLAAARAGALPVRANIAWRAEPSSWRQRLGAFTALRQEIDAEPACTDRLSARTVKFFADGVIEQGTGFVLEPYDDAPHSCGLPNWTPEELREAVAAADAAGFQIHVHAIGDGGVRMALDAIAAAGEAGGRRDRRAVIAHTQLVDPLDRPRFAELGVIANFEPLWAQLDDTMLDLTIPRLGAARSALQYPIATLAALGTRLSFGSDWPVSSADPLAGLAVAVSRQTPQGEPVDGWLPEERVPLLQAIDAYTAGSAHQAFDEQDRGTLAVGSRADLTLLDHDITAMSGVEVADVTARGLWVDGAEVWRR
ncbi:MAG: amidohydrolase [Acidimicrobiales bacterium]